MKNDKTIGFVCGAFDFVHAGHTLMFKEAKIHCDYLIVGLQTDPSIDREDKSRPTQDMFERFTQLDANKYVDKIVIYETEENLYNYLLVNRDIVDCRFVDESYENKDFTGKDIEDITIIYNSRRHSYSSTQIRNKKQENNEEILR